MTGSPSQPLAPSGTIGVVTRALLDRLSRDELQAVMAHCVASAGNGDLRLMQSVLATLQTLGLFHTILDLPFRWSAWRALADFMRATLNRRASLATVQRARLTGSRRASGPNPWGRSACSFCCCRFGS
jgi:Zn-dependent protease with chaperone function